MAKKPAKAVSKTVKAAKAFPKPKAKPRLAAAPKAAKKLAASPSKPPIEEAFRPPAYQRGNFGMLKKMCPFCNSTDVSPDSMGGDIMSWTCRSCGNSFPAPLEASAGSKKESDEDSEYEEMPD